MDSAIKVLKQVIVLNGFGAMFSVFLLGTLFEIAFLYFFYESIKLGLNEPRLTIALYMVTGLTFKILLNYYSVNLVSTFVANFQIELGISYTERYLMMSGLKRNKLNTNEYLYLSTVGVNNLSGEIILPFINLMVDGIVLLVYFSFCYYLFAQKLIIFLIIASLFVYIYLEIYFKRIGNLGFVRSTSETERIKQITESIQFVDEIKVYKGEDRILNDLKVLSKTSMQSWIDIQNILSIPKIILDALLIFALICFFVLFESDDISIIFVLGAIGSRLAPLISRILHNLQILRQSKHNLDAYTSNEFEILKLIRQKNSKCPTVDFEKIIISDLTHKNIKRKVNLEINKSEKICLAGKSGVGKSTLLKILAGIDETYKALIVVDGIKYDTMPILKNIGYAPQKIFLKNGTIKDNIIWPDIEIKNQEKFELVCEIADIENSLKRNIYNDIIKDDGINISGGQRQRIGIARALYHSGQIIFMDESFSSLETGIEVEIINKIKSNFKDLTLLHVSHRQENFAIYDKVCYV